MTGRLDGLEKSGLLRRVREGDDRHRVDIRVTPKGFRLWQKAVHLRSESEEAMMAVLTPSDRRALNRLLTKILLAVEEKA